MPGGRRASSARPVTLLGVRPRVVGVAHVLGDLPARALQIQREAVAHGRRTLPESTDARYAAGVGLGDDVVAAAELDAERALAPRPLSHGIHGAPSWA